MATLPELLRRHRTRGLPVGVCCVVGGSGWVGGVLVVGRWERTPCMNDGSESWCRCLEWLVSVLTCLVGRSVAPLPHGWSSERCSGRSEVGFEGVGGLLGWVGVGRVCAGRFAGWAEGLLADVRAEGEVGRWGCGWSAWVGWVAR